MGNDQATLRQKDINRVNGAKYVQISAKHNRKIIHKNLKPFQQFSGIIKGIYLRTTYLKYDWSQWLCEGLKKDTNKLYDQYCEQFKVSLLKKSQTAQSFQIKNFTSKFLSSLQNQAKKLQTSSFSMEELQKLFEEVKCYFMVQSWFGQLPLNNYFKGTQTTWSSTTKQNQHKGKAQSFFKLKSCDTPQTSNHSQKIYRILLKLTEIYFVNNYYVEEHNVPNECESPKHNPMKRFNSKEYNLIKAISRESNFKQRQIMIFYLLDSIFKFDEMPNQRLDISVDRHKKLYALTKVLGVKNVYCVLKILTQVGQIAQINQIQVIFDHIVKYMVEPIENTKAKSPIKRRLNSSKSPEKRCFQSPYKKSSIIKKKSESIR